MEETLSLASIYTKVVIFLTGIACLQLLYFAYQLHENPPEFIVDAFGQRIVLTAQVRDTNILWVRIIAALYGVMCILAILSLYSIPDTTDPENACSILAWLTLQALIDVVCVIAIICSHKQNFETIWKVAPIPFLAFGILVWAALDSLYKKIR